MQKKKEKTLMKYLTTTLILTFPLVVNGFLICKDASNFVYGVVLMRQGKLIAYALRQLKVYEKNYPTDDLELGQVVVALEVWRLYGTKFEVFILHKSQNYLFSQKEPNLWQWVEFDTLVFPIIPRRLIL